MEKAGQWQKIKEVFDAAVARDPRERSGFLSEACGGDAELRAEVESLLAAHDESDGLSQHPFTGQTLDPPRESTFIGPYRLIEKIGAGGMGQVWLAEQTTPIHRQVALKLIRAGIYDDALLRRFEAERQSLALMDHPAIAKVFEAGATPDGQPYFVMEYVPGEPITEYCDRRKLPIRQRLELFIKACEGVQHAHQKAIIHRDLKPANILVVEVDGKPTPRIIDFGLAKALTPLGADQTLFTQVGAFVGTPGYMSPEQADPGGRDIDTRTDVYSLGVVLYVLLTGFQPFDVKEWQKKPLHEALKELREVDPPRPSTKVALERESSTQAAEQRGTEPRHLASVLHGDLDWITMKALEKDRARRYGTPSDLAADIERYLNYEPVIARPASAGYRMQKYLRRHGVAVGAATGLFVLLVAFAIVEAVQLKRITQERDRANRITDFMTGMFKVSDPSEARGNTVTAREILDKASKDVDTGLAKDPELQAQMMFVMGKVYESLGLYSRAQPLLQKSADIRKSLLGATNEETLRTNAELGLDLRSQAHRAEAERLERQTLDLSQRVLGGESPVTATAMNNLALVLDDAGHYVQAEKLDRDALAIEQKILGPNNPDTVRALSSLVVVLVHEGHYADAEKSDREVISMRTRIFGTEHPDTLAAMNNLAVILYRVGRYSEAEQFDRQILDTKLRILGPDHPDTLATMNNLANVLYQEGRYADAEKVNRDLLEIKKRTMGPDHPITLAAMNNLASTLDKEGRFEEAEKLERETLDARRRVLGPEHPDTLGTLDNLAGVLREEGRFAEAEKLARQVTEIDQRVVGPEHQTTMEAVNGLGAILDAEGRAAEAVKLDRETLDIEKRAFGPEHPMTLTTMGNLTIALAHSGDFAEAEKLGQQTLDIRRRVLGPDHPDTGLSIYKLAQIAALRGRNDEAIALLHEALEHGLSAADLLQGQKTAEFKSLQGDARYEAILADAKARAGQQKTDASRPRS